MKVLNFNDIGNLQIDAICLGSFDGFHLGHQELIKQARLNSKGNTAIVLFSSHPSIYLNSSVKEIMPLEEKVRFCNKFGIDYVIIIDVNKEFFQLNKDEFIEQYLKKISPSLITVGEDFRFGIRGEGTPSYLKKYFNVLEVPLLEEDNKKISSSTIRDLLREGEIEKANKILGYNFEIKGIVEHGYQNGKKLGFPTANIIFKNNAILPNNGVFACLTYVNGIPYKSMVNIGTHPSINELENPIVESHILDFDKDIYGKTIYIEFIKKIREQKKFASMDKLINQLQLDKEEVERILSI